MIGSVLLCASGCASGPEENDRDRSPKENREARERATPRAADPAEAVWSPMVIRSGSLLDVQVYVGGEKEVEVENLRVSDAGTVTLPLIGSIRVSGRSIRLASQILESLYGNYYVSPQVRMDIVRDEDSDAFPWGFVTVLGRVKQQGRVGIPPTRDLTVSSAVQQAGGFDTSAKITAIRVTRQMPNGKSKAIDVNMRNIGQEGKTDEDIILYPNDVVFIPEMLF